METVFDRSIGETKEGSSSMMLDNFAHKNYTHGKIRTKSLRKKVAGRKRTALAE